MPSITSRQASFSKKEEERALRFLAATVDSNIKVA
jgi:hypothetical protein